MSPDNATTPDPNAAVARATVYIVDDDPSVRSSLVRLLNSCDYEAKAFASSLSFLAFRTASLPDAVLPAARPAPECLVLDICMPGMDGLELQTELTRRSDTIPIIFITAHGDQRTTAQAMQGGAVAFLSKPFDQQDLLQSIQTALNIGRDNTNDVPSA